MLLALVVMAGLLALGNIVFWPLRPAPALVAPPAEGSRALAVTAAVSHYFGWTGVFVWFAILLLPLVYVPRDLASAPRRKRLDGRAARDLPPAPRLAPSGPLAPPRKDYPRLLNFENNQKRAIASHENHGPGLDAAIGASQ
jgi:hypothetical protein